MAGPSSGADLSAFTLTPEIVEAAIESVWAGRPSRCLEISPTHAVAELDIDQDNMRPGGFVPGPTLFGLADVALWYMTFGALGRIEPMALTSDLSIRYLRPAQGARATARAELDKVGRLMVIGTVRIWMDDRADKPVATAQGTYVLPKPDGLANPGQADTSG